MSTGWIIFIVCIVFVISGALPLIRNRGVGKPPPRKETLHDWRNDNK